VPNETIDNPIIIGLNPIALANRDVFLMSNSAPIQSSVNPIKNKKNCKIIIYDKFCIETRI
jgi:hypothetical protein